MRSCLYLLQLVVVGGLLSACASQATLTGGPKDVAPPEMKESQPPSGSTFFDGNKVEITFNEFFSLNAPNDSILINPPLQKTPDYTIKGKKLVIGFKEELKPNTTYHISFNGAVQDITEGNRLRQQDILFSTGSQTDSFSIKGFVYDAYSRQPLPQTCVLLYSEPNDSNPITHKPDYFTLTDNRGHFRFDHLPDRNFQLFAVEDHNKNRLFDLPDEKIAFLPDNKPIMASYILSDSSLQSDTFNLYIFQEKEQKIKLLRKSEQFFGCHLFVFNQAIDTFALISMENSPAPCITVKNAGKDSLHIYLTDTTIPSNSRWAVIANGTIIDTISLQSVAVLPTGKDKTIPHFQLTCPDKVEIDSLCRISSNLPIRRIDTMAFTLTEIDSKDTLTISPVPVTLFPMYMTINYPLQPRKQYVLEAADSICQAYNGQFNDSIRFKFSIKSAKEYGNLALHLHFPEKNHYIVQLADAQNGKTLYERLISPDDMSEDSHTDLNFSNIKEKSYRLRIIRDDNHNGKWDTGDYLRQQQAESLFYNSQAWEVKKNWTIEENLEITF